MERSIGSRFKIDNILLEVVPADKGCIGCYFYNISCVNGYDDILGECDSHKRCDKISILFKRIYDPIGTYSKTYDINQKSKGLYWFIQTVLGCWTCFIWKERLVKGLNMKVVCSKL